MHDFAIITDSCCDLPPQLIQELSLTVLPLTFHMGGGEYRNYPDGREMPFDEFYQKLRGGVECTTSAVNAEAFSQAMEAHLQSGKDVLCIAFSSGLSSTCSAASLAARELSAKYPQNKIYVVDSLSASLGQGLLVLLAARERAAGKGIDEVRDWTEQNRLHLCHWFTVDDLNHLKRGGRISAATALFGTMLNIKPVLHVDNEGRLVNVGKVRGRRASLTALVDEMEKTALDPAAQTVCISHGGAPEDAARVAADIQARFGVETIVTNYVGPVIGAHSGPGTIALFFLGSHR